MPLAFATDPHDVPVFNPKIPIDIYVLKIQKHSTFRRKTRSAGSIARPRR